MEPLPSRGQLGSPSVAASASEKRPSARCWAESSKRARLRRKEAARELQRQVDTLQGQLTELQDAQLVRPPGATEALLEAKSACLDQRVARQSTVRRNRSLKSAIQELLAAASKAETLFAKSLREQQEPSYTPNLQTLAYEPSVDDAIFRELEARNRVQRREWDRVFRAVGITEDSGAMDCAELVRDATTAPATPGAESPLMIQVLGVQALPFSASVIVAGIQQFSRRHCLVCRSESKPEGTVWWTKTRYCLRDEETGAPATLLVRGVLSFLRDGESVAMVWTVSSRSETTQSQHCLPSIEVDERAWCVVEPAVRSTGAPTAVSTPVCRMRTCFQLTPRVSGDSVVLGSDGARVIEELMLPSLRGMLREAYQGMENCFCDEMRRREAAAEAATSGHRCA